MSDKVDGAREPAMSEASMSTASLRERLDVLLAHSRHLGSAEQAADAVNAVLTWLADSKLRIVPEEAANMDSVIAIRILVAGKDALFCAAEDPQVEDAQKCFSAMVKAAPSNASALGMEDSHDNT